MGQWLLYSNEVTKLLAANLSKVSQLAIFHVIGDLAGALVTQFGDGSGFLGVANTREQISYLVRIHAGCGDLDWTSPIEIVVAKCKCELLELCLCQI